VNTSVFSRSTAKTLENGSKAAGKQCWKGRFSVITNYWLIVVSIHEAILFELKPLSYLFLVEKI